MIDKLPDSVILELLEELPQLRLVNRRLFSLAELRFRSRLLSYYNYNDDQIDELAADVRETLHLDSWRIVEDVARRDYWFFGPEHVVKFNGYPLNCVDHEKGYYTLNGAPWGLYIMKWSNQYLEYTTMLRAGRYKLYLDIYAPKLHELSKKRLLVTGSSVTKQHFQSSPPLSWLETQLHTLNGDHSDPTNDDSDFTHHNMDCEAMRLVVGSVVVGPSDQNDWGEVTLRIENVDWSDQFSGLVFNYLCFSPEHQNSKQTSEWMLQSTNPRSSPSHALSMVYKRANERKRRWLSSPK